LWQLAKYLSQAKFQKIIGTVEWRFHNGDPHTPCLILTHPTAPKSNNKKSNKKIKTETPTKVKFQLQLLMGSESLDWIPAARFFPNRANLKGDVATPHYNAILAQDAQWTAMRDLLLSEELLHLSAAACLCKVWCLQRGFFRAHDGFGEHHLALLLLYLYRTKRANPRMAPLQVFTVFCKFLVEWWGDDANKQYMQVLVMPEQDTHESQTVASCLHAKLYATQAKESPVNKLMAGDPATLLDCYREFSDGPVFVDPTMMCNYLSNISTAFCRAVGSHAKGTIDALHSHHRPFSYIFLAHARFWSCMDAYMRIPIKSIQWKLSKEWKLKIDRGKYESLTRGLLDVLGRALGDRVMDLRVLTTGNGEVSDGGSDEIPTHAINSGHVANSSNISPVGDETLVLGVKLNPDTCNRIVDRGPPADDTEATKAFVDLWGKVAELRRFKDGAIVHAVVWNTPQHEDEYVVIEGDDKTQGGIVERIIRHILKVHFTGDKKNTPQFCLREMLSIVDGVHTNDQEDRVFSNSHAAHKNILNAFDDLSKFLLQHSAQTLPVPGEADKMQSRLGIPLPIDAVEPLSPALRYSELFPPIPHPLLGGQRSAGKKVSGVVCSSPILVQIRFGHSSKWPTDIKAMGAAKTAMLIQLADGIEEMMKRRGNDGFGGPVYVGPGFLDVGYKGYSWRIVVRADPELYLLRALHKPGPEALGLLQILTKEHLVSASHHSMIHAVHTSHPSSGAVVRMMKRWLAAHMLSDLIPLEVVDLLVAKVYCDHDSPMDAPGTAMAGFMRVLHLLSNHNWVR
jgi:U3 small nucleolar RNA-associated protein 22